MSKMNTQIRMYLHTYKQYYFIFIILRYNYVYILLINGILKYKL